MSSFVKSTVRLRASFSDRIGAEPSSSSSRLGLTPFIPLFAAARERSTYPKSWRAMLGRTWRLPTTRRDGSISLEATAKREGARRLDCT
eukprot:CAMPEP_0185422100 /NCGR_PEP_ID=MMETSP1365-20130426/11503_1 /TAXON_ID=38817 /ORGANISM="Gephyrocapsa oceanica, Strain RCC1303" /LENGTH=88 /DNA_ID=CAMNT_0028025873 /DNA_START=416 /DNA_END=678 /DNA_ORIENTATION=+